MDRFKKIVIEQKFERLRDQGRFVDPLLEQEISKYSFDDFMVSPSRAEFRVDGVLHSEYDEPAVVYMYEDSDQKLDTELIIKKIGWKDIETYGETELTKEWYKNGVLHRDNGPAVIGFEPRDSTIDSDDFLYIFTETWYIDGKKHRDNAPAVVSYYETGAIAIEEWYKHGLEHREDGPAYVEYYASGMPYMEIWSKNNIRQREDGPALVMYYENGLVKKEVWYKNGKIGRDDNMPAILSYYKNKKIKSEIFYEEGRKVFESQNYSNGKLKAEIIFIDSLYQPDMFEYDRDGNKTKKVWKRNEIYRERD